MKKWICALLMLTGCVWAEVTIDDGIVVVFPNDIGNTDYRFNAEDSVECMKYMDMGGEKSARAYKGEYGWCVSDVCSSVLDSSIFFLESNTCGTFEDFFWNHGFEVYDGDCFTYEFIALSDATHSVVDVAIDELKHFQKCGYFDISDEKMDSIVKEMEQGMIPKTKRNFGRNIYVADCGDGSGCVASCDHTGGCFGDIYYSSSIKNVLVARNATDALPYRMDFAARIVAENGRLNVPADLEGRSFVLFNLNGRVLRKGELSNNMALPREPAVLRIKGVGDMYVK